MGKIVNTSIFLALLFAACNKEGEIIDAIDKVFPEHDAITFSSFNQEEEAVTRATTPLNDDFTVWGYKTMSVDMVQKVFQGYKVKYVAGSGGSTADNTDNYSYVNGTDQDIKYWDFAASGYNFWGYTGGNYDESSNTLTISELSQSVTEPDVKDKMFSSIYHRSPVSKDVVQLQFKRPYAKVRMMFYCSDAIDDGDKVEIGASTFVPESPNQLITRGVLEVTYSQSGNASETYKTTSTTTADHLSFDPVNLTNESGTASNNAALAKPSDGTDYYYVIPYDYNQAFTLSTTIDGDVKTATLPKEFMNWKPNFVYTYLFKITEASKKIEFYEVKIDPWKYGGSQNEEWKNW